MLGSSWIAKARKKQEDTKTTRKVTNAARKRNANQYTDT